MIQRQSSTPRTTVEAGARAAALAIGRILRRPGTAKDIEEPSRAVIAARLGERAVAVWFTVTGSEPGRFAALLREPDAAALAGHLVQSSGGTVVGERERAALAELGNIAASAFLNGVAQLVAGACVPSPPELVVGDVTLLMDAALGEFGHAWVCHVDVDDRTLWLVWIS